LKAPAYGTDCYPNWEIGKKITLSDIFKPHNMDFIAQSTDKIYGMADGQIFLEEEKISHTHVHAHGYGKVPHSYAYRNNANPDSKKP
jgi:hypothetical protein